MAIKHTAEEIKAMASRVVNTKYCDLYQALESVCGKFSEETKELHIRVWDEVEDLITYNDIYTNTYGM